MWLATKVSVILSGMIAWGAVERLSGLAFVRTCQLVRGWPF